MTTTEQRPLRYIDSDGHILEPPTAMLEFAPEKYRDRIWHVEQDGDGRQWVVYNGQRHPATGLAGTAGFSDDDVDRVRNGELQYLETRPVRLDRVAATGRSRPGRHRAVGALPDVHAGSAERDRRGVRPGAGPGVQRLVRRRTWRRVRVGCSGPGRCRRSTIPTTCRESSTRSATWPSLPGMVSVFMRPNPAIEWRYFNDPVYDPIWAALQDADLPVAFHPFLAPDLPGACEGLKLARPRDADGSYMALEEFESADQYGGGNSTIYFTQAIANPVDVMSAICYITSGGVAERYPGAKFMFLEANGGWLVPWLERLDHHAKKFSWDVPWLKMLPSEYFRRQCWISFDPDESMLAFTANSPLCGADRIIWASDYPHPDAKFPGVTEELTRRSRV